MTKKLLFILILFSLLAVGCQRETGHGERVSPMDLKPYDLYLPNGFPMPDFPDDNELTKARVALGKKLFYDPILSRDSSLSCASCHKPALAFADNVAISPGVEGRLGLRNSPTLGNVAYLTLINKDGGVPKLDFQPLVPIEDENEMDLHPLVAAERLNAHPDYPVLFLKAYDRDAHPFTITRALGAFMRILISGNSPYDQYTYQGNESALSAAQVRGKDLFFSERLSCGNCHTGFNFTNNQFENNGLYEDYEDDGRQRVTGLPEDDGKFRIPTLRNIEKTAPYMHDGSLSTLEAVVDHYNAGGSGHHNKSPLIKPLNLSAQEQSDLIAFLKSLTDESFLTNPEFQ